MTEIFCLHLLIGDQRVVSPKDQTFQRFSYTCTEPMIFHRKDRNPQRQRHDNLSFTMSQKSKPIIWFVRSNKFYWWRKKYGVLLPGTVVVWSCLRDVEGVHEIKILSDINFKRFTERSEFCRLSSYNNFIRFYCLFDLGDPKKNKISYGICCLDIGGSNYIQRGVYVVENTFNNKKNHLRKLLIFTIFSCLILF
jgi:hypothetical protein